MPRPQLVFCYICHREFGKASIGIHEVACLKKWNDENDRLPKKDRKKPPVKPTGSFDQRLDEGGFSDDGTPIKVRGVDPNLDAYNAAANQTNVVVCGTCNRSFAPDRLKIHELHCHAAPLKKSVYEARKPDFDVKILQTPLPGKTLSSSFGGKGRAAPMVASSSDGMPRCKKCGRTFTADRIARHEQNCRAEPLKQNVVPKLSQSTTVSNRSAKIRCNQCGKMTDDASKFCSNCGKPIQKNTHCTGCGSTLQAGVKFCSSCGKPVGSNKSNCAYLPEPDSLCFIRSPLHKWMNGELKIVCYICGQEFDQKLIGIHTCQCLRKWRIENECKSQRSRRETPAPLGSKQISDKITYNHNETWSSDQFSFAKRAYCLKDHSEQVPFLVKPCFPQL